jgi:WD40 repeat protein
MIRKLLLLLVLINISPGCSNLMTAAPADHVLAGIHEYGTTALAFSVDGQQFISGGFRGDIRIWDAATRHPLGRSHAHRGPVRAIRPLGGDRYASGGDDGRLILWQRQSVRRQVDGAAVSALTLFQGQLVSGHADGRVRVWSIDTLRLLREIPVDGVVVGLDARQGLLAIGLRRQILLLDADFTPLKSLPTRHTPHDLQFSPDGRTLAAGSWFRVNLWDLESGEMRSIPTEHNGLLTSIAYSPDGRYLATLGRHTDSAIRILDTTGYGVVKRYQAHDLCGTIIRFSPDGRLLASGSDDESVHLHRLEQAPYFIKGATPSAH